MSKEFYIRQAGVDDIADLLKLYRHLNPEDEPCPTDLAQENL